jgi:hypothetical protein
LGWVVAVAPLSPLGFASARDDEDATAAMLEPVQALVVFMAKLPIEEHTTTFARRGVLTIESHAPFPGRRLPTAGNGDSACTRRRTG